MRDLSRSNIEELHAVSVRRIRVKDLCFAYVLQLHACLHQNFNWHFVKDFLLACWIVSQVHHGLHAADASVRVRPLVHSRRHLLNWPPVEEDSFAASRGVIAELDFLHPVENLLKRLERETTLDPLVVAEGRSVQLTQRYLVNTVLLSIRQENVAPHAHLAFFGVKIFLDSTSRLSQTPSAAVTYV